MLDQQVKRASRPARRLPHCTVSPDYGRLPQRRERLDADYRRHPGGVQVTEPEKTGFFKRTKGFAQEKYAEGKAKKEAAAAAARTFYEEAEKQYGRLVASELFALRRIELYDGGFVRVGGYRNTEGGPRPRDLDFYVVAYDAPFEKLRAIKADTTVEDKSAGGRALASAATFGVSKLAANENRHAFLTISTDREVYTLQDKGGRAHLKLEGAGQGILDALASKNAAAPAPPAQSVADQLRDLAGLHRDGVLSDDEFAAPKRSFSARPRTRSTPLASGERGLSHLLSAMPHAASPAQSRPGGPRPPRWPRVRPRCPLRPRPASPRPGALSPRPRRPPSCAGRRRGVD